MILRREGEREKKKMSVSALVRVEMKRKDSAQEIYIHINKENAVTANDRTAEAALLCITAETAGKNEFRVPI